jgi:hypothetical protein
MKKILLAVLFGLGLSQNTLAEERTVQDTVETTQSTDGTAQTAQERRSTTTTDTDSRVSKGGFFIEPLIFASQEDTSVNTSQLPIINSDTSGEARGYGVGLRFGGHVHEAVLLGLDARYAKLRMSDSTFYDDVNADVYNIAPMVGLQTPLWGIRLMAGYVVAGENNPDAGNQGVDLKFKEAQGWRLGAGVHIAAVGVNLEYQDLKYNSTEVESLGPVAVNNNTSVDADTKGYSLSVSFPIEL